MRKIKSWTHTTVSQEKLSNDLSVIHIDTVFNNEIILNEHTENKHTLS